MKFMVRRVRRDERGSALLIALAFLGLFSLFLAATLASAEGGLHIDESLKVQPVRMYSADGAVEKAIQALRYDQSHGRDDGVNCDSSVQLNGRTMHISCDPQDGSGHSELGGSSPTLGIIGLSNGASGEAGYQQTGNSIVRIDGGLYSNSTLSFLGSSNQCSGTDNNCQQLNLCPANEKTVTDASYVSVNINGVPTRVVASNTAGFVGATGNTDVGAPIRGSGIPAGAKIQTYLGPTSVSLDKPPTVLASPRTVTFRENFPQRQEHCHPPATAHGKVTALLGPCDRSRVVSIQFNCKDTAAAVVGDLTGSDPAYPPDQASGFVLRNVPACGTARIVEFEPGKYTDVDALNALSTCDKVLWFKPGTYYFDFSASANPVWTIGASSNGNHTLVAGAKTWSDHGVFTGSIEKSGTRWFVNAQSNVFDSTDKNNAWINTSTNLPYGAKIIDVPANNRVEIDRGPLNGNGGNGLLFTKNSQASMCESQITGEHAGAEFILGGTSQIFVNNGRTELCAPVVGSRQQIALYGVKTATGDLVAQSGCTVLQPYPTVGCPALRTGGPKPMFLVHGTVYMPGSVIDLSLQTVSYQIVSRGIIARVVALGISPSAEFKDPLIYSPNFGSVVGAPRRVLLVACEGRPCASGGTPKLRAMVRIEDTEPGTQNVSVGNRVIIESWTVLR